MICPHCGKEIKVVEKAGRKEIHARFLVSWNTQDIIQHKKVTVGAKKAIDKAIKNADYTEAEIFKAFKNYATVLHSSNYFWDYKWTMEDFLNRGLGKFVDEAEPLANTKKKEKQKKSSPYDCFDCGGG